MAKKPTKGQEIAGLCAISKLGQREVAKLIDAAIAEAVAQEREACAEMVEHWQPRLVTPTVMLSDAVASAIRGRK